jgi:hypothetical protein
MMKDKCLFLGHCPRCGEDHGAGVCKFHGKKHRQLTARGNVRSEHKPAVVRGDAPKYLVLETKWKSVVSEHRTEKAARREKKRIIKEHGGVYLILEYRVIY